MKIEAPMRGTAANIFLIGFSGSGKTVTGKLLSRNFRRAFVDTDKRIEKRHKMSIPEIFARLGEQKFRKMESETIANLINEKRARKRVVALGGGSFLLADNRRMISSAGIVVWLSCSRQEIYRRLSSLHDRPLLAVVPISGETVRQARLKRIAKLLRQREYHYRTADLRVSTSNRSPVNVARLIELKLGNYESN